MIKSEYLSLLSEPEIALVYTQRLKMTFTKKNWCTFGTVVACGTSDMKLFSEKVRTFRRVDTQKRMQKPHMKSCIFKKTQAPRTHGNQVL